jgi:hypothetical protein
MKQIGEEYYKLNEANNVSQPNDGDKLIPPTPLRLFEIDESKPEEKSKQEVNGKSNIPTVRVQENS